MLRFTLFGFPVTIHWSFWLILALLGSPMIQGEQGIIKIALWVAAGFLSILIHELGHTFLQRAYGARAQIFLYQFGGLAIPDRGFTRGKQIIISLGGPFLQIAVGLIAGQVLEFIAANPSRPWMLVVFLWSFHWVSIIWGLLNLLPIYPLDGGHVLKGILPPSKEKLTYLIGMVCAVGLGIYMLTRPNPSIWNTALCAILAWQNFQRWQGKQPASTI